MNDRDVEKQSFMLYRPMPLDLRKDKTLIQAPKDPEEFVRSFLRAAAPRKREEQIEKLSSRKEMVMDAIKPRKKTERKRRKKKALSIKQKKQLNMNDIPPEQQKYEVYKPLHQLWLDYMRDSLQLQNQMSTYGPVNSAFSLFEIEEKPTDSSNFHTASHMTKSKCPSYIGQSGIVIQESRNAFKMITKADVLKTIPKASTVFTLSIDSLVVNIYGSHLRYRAGDRANRKFKMKPTVDL